jgi:hypothetical protein
MSALVEIRHFPGDAHLVALRIEVRNAPYTADAAPGSVPKTLAADAVGTYRPDPCDYYAALHTFSVLASRSPVALCVSLSASIGWKYMDAASAGKSRLTLRDALAGLEAGTLGTLIMIAWLLLCSVSAGYTIWIVPNLFATAIYGSGVYQNHFLRASWPGIALILAIYGAGGMVWGTLCGAFMKSGQRPRFFALTGAIVGLIVYYFFNLIWKYADPLIPLYAPARALQVGHVFWGMALARAPLYSRRIAESAMDKTEEHQDEAAVRSGEVIL